MTAHPYKYNTREGLEDMLEEATETTVRQASTITTLRAQLAEANGIIQRLCLSVAYNKTSSKALLESQKAAYEYLDKVTTA